MLLYYYRQKYPFSKME